MQQVGDIDMNLPGNNDQNTNTNSNSGNIFNNSTTQENTSTSQPLASQGQEDFFTISNIINIILITVGIVLILLSIAILIRLK